jgi:hypothetical protein
MSESIIGISVSAVLLGIILVFAGMVSSCSCKMKSKAMGLNYDFGMIQGCIVETKDGQKVDIKNYRVID